MAKFSLGRSHVKLKAIFGKTHLSKEYLSSFGLWALCALRKKAHFRTHAPTLKPLTAPHPLPPAWKREWKKKKKSCFCFCFRWSNQGCCSTCYTFTCILIVASCLLACATLIWMHLELKRDFNDLRHRMELGLRFKGMKDRLFAKICVWTVGFVVFVVVCNPYFEYKVVWAHSCMWWNENCVLTDYTVSVVDLVTPVICDYFESLMPKLS